MGTKLTIVTGKIRHQTLTNAEKDALLRPFPDGRGGNRSSIKYTQHNKLLGDSVNN